MKLAALTYGLWLMAYGMEEVNDIYSMHDDIIFRYWSKYLACIFYRYDHEIWSKERVEYFLFREMSSYTFHGPLSRSGDSR